MIEDMYAQQCLAPHETWMEMAVAAKPTGGRERDLSG